MQKVVLEKRGKKVLTKGVSADIMGHAVERG